MNHSTQHASAALASEDATDNATSPSANSLSASGVDRVLNLGKSLVGTVGAAAAAEAADSSAAIARLFHAATHDSLTGLPTRSVLLERLATELRDVAGVGQVAVLFVDLDNFKRVNDSLGHDSGDLVLIEMARRISGCVGPGDTVSRFGGDEVVVLHPEAAGGSEVAVGARILQAMAFPIHVSGREVVVTASVGVAVANRDGQSAEPLLRDADTALYSAKSRGRSRMVRFNEELHARVARRLQIESDLRAALRDEQLFVHYQPQVNLQTGRIVGVEALARWDHPLHGRVPPAEFIAVAEECRLIGALGRQVMRSACRQLARWNAEAPEFPLTMTVNVSPQQLDDPCFLADLRIVLSGTGISPASLCLELTESVLMDRDSNIVQVLERVREMGVYVAIDDFGTEYSSLSRLRGLPVEVLKIDRSFIDGLPAESGDTAIVSSILSLALAMGKHVIAEGVERPEQAAALHDMGCVVAQGYLFSAPVSPRHISLMMGRSFLQSAAAGEGSPPLARTEPSPRRGHRSFIDEFLDHIGAPMGVKKGERS